MIAPIDWHAVGVQMAGMLWLFGIGGLATYCAGRFYGWRMGVAAFLFFVVVVMILDNATH